MLTSKELRALESHLSTNDAANRVRRTPATIRSWVHRGFLKPVNPGDKGPKVFRVVDVLRCDRDRRETPAVKQPA